MGQAYTHHPEAVPQVGVGVLKEGPAGGALFSAGLLSLLSGPAVTTHLAGQTQDSGLLLDHVAPQHTLASAGDFPQTRGLPSPLQSHQAACLSQDSAGSSPQEPQVHLLTCQARLSSSRLRATEPSGNISSLPASLSLVPRRPADTPAGRREAEVSVRACDPPAATALLPWDLCVR